MPPIFFVLVLFSLSSLVESATKRFTLVISWADANIDGIPRRVLAFNNSYPGPLIECTDGDTLEITVVNHAEEATSVHWHGIHQRGTNNMDGPAYVTQCPIGVNKTRLYRFTIQDQSGLFWYHSHIRTQLADGLKGPILIHSKSGQHCSKTFDASLYDDYYEERNCSRYRDKKWDSTVSVLTWKKEMKEFHQTFGMKRSVEETNQRSNTSTASTGSNNGNTRVPPPTVAQKSDCADQLFNFYDGYDFSFKHNNYGNEKVGKEKMLFLSDWYWNETRILLPKIISGELTFLAQSPDSVVINGLGQGYCSSLGSVCFYSELAVPLNDVIRLSIFNGAGDADLHFSIDNHILTIIETEGIDVEPYDVDFIQLNIGQRYTVEINSGKIPKNFWIRVSIVGEPEKAVRAILREGESGRALPTTQPSFVVPPTGIGSQGVCPIDLFTTCTIDIPTNLLPVPPVDAPQKADYVFVFNVRFDNGMININDNPFKPPSDTTLLDLVLAGKPLPASANMNYIETGSVVDIIVNVQIVPIQHPMHLHGHEFFILGYGSLDAGSYNATLHESSLNYFNPLRRDTISVNADSWIYIRYVADNPGVWLFHCHIVWHSSRGLATGFVEGEDEIRQLFGSKSTPLTCDVIEDNAGA